MAKGKEAKPPKSIENRRARHDFAILEEVEAGIVLVGSEVKSIYRGKAHLTDAYCRVVRDEMILFGFDVEPYDQTAAFGHERRRDRKLLMNRREIAVYQRKSQEKGLSIIPLRVYFNEKGRVKVLIGLGRGKALYDKRKTLQEKETKREIERARALRD